MLNGLESGLGLDVVVWLQTNGNGLFDTLAQALHFMGGTLFYLLILALVFWALDKPLGIRLVFALILGVVVTEGLKLLLQTPRPHQLYPDLVTALVEQEGYGIPSGHVLNAMVIWGTVALWIKRRWVWIAFSIYILLMGWSRMYAGVHYVQDVVVGLVVGALTLWLYDWLANAIMKRWPGLNLTAQIALFALGGLIIALLLWESEAGQTVAGVLLGGGTGLLIEMRIVGFSAAGSVQGRALRYAIGLAISLAVFFGLDMLFDGLEPEQVFRVMRYALVGLTMTLGWPWLAARTGLMRARGRTGQ